MPIRINLMAERQAAEELRRRDPVKRAIWAGAVLVAVVLLYSLSLQYKLMQAGNDLDSYESRWKAKEKQYSQATNNLTQIKKVEDNLAALQQLAANRFLWATPLDALQRAMVDAIQVTRLASDMNYTYAEATTVDKKTRPATTTEEIKITIDAKDFKPSEQNDSKFQESIARSPYFGSKLATNGLIMIGRAPTQTDPESGKTFRTFTLEGRYPKKAR